MSAPDPVSIDAVAAAIAEYRGAPWAYEQDRCIARALAAGGFLRTPEDRAVLDAAEAETAAEDAEMEWVRQSVWSESKTIELADARRRAGRERRRAVVARRAAGGTEENQ